MKALLLPKQKFNPRKAAVFGVASAIVGIIILIAVFADTGFSPTGGRPFAANSAFNTTVPGGPALDPNSAAMVANLTYNTHPGIAYLYNNGKPIFYADSSTPTYTVKCTEAWGTCPFSGLAVPIPANAKPDTDSDGHMFVVNIATHTEYDFWQYKFNGGSPTTSWGGTADINGNGQSSRGTAYASGTAGLAGLVRLSDIRSGVINHALVFSTSDCAAPSSNFRYPAIHSDGKYTGTGAIPEGSRVQLDPSINVDGIANITAGEKMVAKALQQYGAYAVDCAGSTGPGGMGYYFEDPREEGVADPYPGVGFAWDYFGMDHIPWKSLKVLNASVTQPPSSNPVPPSVSMTSPANGATVAGVVTVSANASDSVGISNVQFKLDGANLGNPITTSPYTYSWNTSSTSNGTHTLTATATDTAGLSSTTSNDTITVSNADIVPPSAPTGLTAAAATSARINLAWKASTDNTGITAYKIYRNGSTTPLATVSGSTLSYADVQVSAGTTYSYQVSAVDAAGNESAKSATASASTPSASDTTPPSVPTGLSSSSITTSSAVLNWNASTDTGGSGLAGYHLYRNGALIASPSGTSYTDSGLAAGTSYTYSVSAYDNAANGSVASTPLTVTTSSSTSDTLAPSAPSSLRTTSISRSSISVTWSPSTDNVGVAGYRIWRGDGNYNNWVNIGTVSGSTLTFTNNNLRRGTTYTYGIRAYDAAGNISGGSNTIRVSTSH